MNPRRDESITSQTGNAHSPRARRSPVSCWRAVVLCEVVVTLTAGLAAQALGDDVLRVIPGDNARWVDILTIQDQDGLAAKPLGDDDDDDAVQGVTAVERAAAAERAALLERQFDQMVFGGAQRVLVLDGGRRQVVAGQESANGVRRQTESILDTEIRTVDARCSLSEAQKKKLQLAGRGDIARWLSRVSELRMKCTAAAMDLQQYQAIMLELQSMRYVPQYGPFGETSLFRKTLRTTLTDEQLARFQALVRERSVERVEDALSNWDRAAGRTKLVGEHRQKFIDTLVEHGNFPQTSSPYIQYFVWLEAGRLEDQLKPLLDETQRLAVKQQVSNARRVEQVLRSTGQWPVAQPADDDF